MSINTKAAYKAYDKLSVTEHPLTDEIISCIKNKDLNGISVRVFNVLEEAAKGRYKELNRFKGIMLESGALGSAMTGSGSAVFGIFNNRSCAYNAKKRFLKRGVNSFVTQPVERKGMLIFGTGKPNQRLTSLLNNALFFTEFKFCFSVRIIVFQSKFKSAFFGNNAVQRFCFFDIVFARLLVK